MFRRIMRHEWRLLAVDRTPWMVLAVFGLALAYGATNGARWVGFQEAAIAAALKEERDRYAAAAAEIADLERENRPLERFGDPRNPDAVGRDFGARYAIMPPLPFAATSIGQSDLLPYYARVTTESSETLLALGELENPHRLLAGRFDLAFVIVYLLPLLIVALGYNLISSDKEGGTLALMMSQPVRLSTLLASKIGFRALLLVGVIAAFVPIALAVGAIRVPDGASIGRLLLWLAIVAAYAAFWFALVIAVTSFGRGSATNGIVLASLWLVLGLVVPSALNLLSTTVYPMPSRVEMIQAMRAASDEAQAEGSTLLARYFEDHPELAGVAEDAMTEFTATRMAVAEEVDRRVSPVLQSYEEQLEAQRSLVSRLGFLSPAIITLEALNDIAGTGAARNRHFVAIVERFHEEWLAHFTSRIIDGAKLLDYENLPAFQYEEEGFGRVVVRVATNIAALLIVAIVVGLAGFRRMRAYPLVT